MGRHKFSTSEKIVEKMVRYKDHIFEMNKLGVTNKEIREYINSKPPVLEISMYQFNYHMRNLFGIYRKRWTNAKN